MALESPPRADDAADAEGASTAASSGAVGTAAAFLPHMLQHAGLLAGAAFLSSLAGGLLFAVLGLVAVVPMAVRLRRRSSSWRAPMVAVAAFTVMFVLMTGITWSM